MSSFTIGTAVVHHDMANDRAGYVVGIKAAGRGESILGAHGFQPVRADLEIVFDGGASITTTPDAIAARWLAEAERRGLEPISAADAEALRAKALQRRAEQQELARAEREEAERARAAFVADAETRFPAGAKAVIVAELQQDESDSMSDYHNSRTVRTIILGFSHHERDLFPEMRKAARRHPETAALADAPEEAEHRQKYGMGGGYFLKDGYRYSNGWKVRKVRASRPEHVPTGEWADDLQAETATAPAAHGATGGQIVEHVHTKKGFPMFIITLADRVERERFEMLRDAAKDAGGWYSRAWGTSPAGFAFKARDAAEAFLAEHFSADAPASPASAPAAPAAPARAPAAKGAATAEKLRTLADGMTRAIADKFADRRRNTPKQQREAQSARLDGYQMERAQKAMRALADMHEAGTVPAVLAGITTKAAILDLVAAEISRTGGYYDAGHETGRPARQTPAALALWDIVNESGAERRKADDLQRKIDALRFAKIPGYFPTPADVVAEMIEAADLPDGPCKILEPSAGSGAILEAVKEAAPGAELVAFERHCSLRAILEAKGFSLTGSDFLESDPALQVDRVLMNPPFENGQDMEHVRRAFAHLKPGGRLVAIMSPGPFFRSDSRARAFRDWFDDLGGERRDIAAGAFKESGTGVATVIVVLDAPAGADLVDAEPAAPGLLLCMMGGR